METPQIHAAAAAAGIAPEAFDQVTARVQAHFAGRTPTPADLDTFLAGLPTWEKAGIAYAIFAKLHPNTRRDVHRTYNPQPPQPVHSLRPVTRSLTPEELAAHDAQAAREGWSRAEYTEKARALQQTPPSPQA
jgi:hypothetical protein